MIFLLVVVAVLLLMVVTDTNPLLQLNVPDGIELAGDTAWVRDMIIVNVNGVGDQSGRARMKQARHDIDAKKRKWLEASGYYYMYPLAFRQSGTDGDLKTRYQPKTRYQLKTIYFVHVFIK